MNCRHSTFHPNARCYMLSEYPHCYYYHQFALLLSSTPMQVHHDEGPGDILVFLTGQDEIDSAERLIRVGGRLTAERYSC